MTKANDYYITDIFILCPFSSERKAIKFIFPSRWKRKTKNKKKIASQLNTNKKV